MDITITVDNLRNLVNGLNNAIIAYREVRNRYYFCPDTMHPIWESLLNEDRNSVEKKFDKRLMALNQVYTQLLEKEVLVMRGDK